MKQFSPLQSRLLAFLADGQCHSGSDLGNILGVSRTAIWKNISQLIDAGLAINRIAQQGYQLAKPFIALDESLLRNHLNQTNFDRTLDFHLFSEIDSTNRFLKDLPLSQHIDVCCAEKQTLGRGRFGRQWISPFGENIYFSSRWQFDCCLSQLSGLSLVVSLATLDCLRKNNIAHDILIKWPNDLLWHHKKLCGVLIEVIAEPNSSAQVIIGIGMNINSPTHMQELADKPACSLFEITGKQFDRNQLIADLLISLNNYLQRFLQNGFSAFMEEWKKTDYLAGNLITLSQPTGKISGVACGITSSGQLCIEDHNGKLFELSSGDTTLA